MSTRPIPLPARDFEAEYAWLKRLPTAPETDRKQDEWFADPAVRQWWANNRQTPEPEPPSGTIDTRPKGDIEW